MLDVENGSVASALVHLTPDEQPRLFAQKRITLPVMHSPTATEISRATQKASRDALMHASDVAARVRAHAAHPAAGDIERVAVFLHAPWTSIRTGSGGRISTDAPEPMLAQFRDMTEQSFGRIPVSFHAFGTTAAPAIHGLFDEGGSALVVSVTGEVTELFLTEDGILIGHATVPTGLNAMVRTLQSHGGLSLLEAHSALTLMDTPTPRHALWSEAFMSGTEHVLADIEDAVRALVHTSPVRHIFVIAPQKNSVWFARALAQYDAIGELFPAGASVRDIRPHHVLPYISAHTNPGDVTLMLEGLCVESRFGIY